MAPLPASVWSSFPRILLLGQSFNTYMTILHALCIFWNVLYIQLKRQTASCQRPPNERGRPNVLMSEVTRKCFLAVLCLASRASVRLMK
jgi:hypothetical protein